MLATPDLAATASALSSRLGVPATPGGRHPGRGTRNALFVLGRRCYLEVIGPDPEQPAPAGARWFSIDSLTTPRLVTWAAQGAGLERIVAEAAKRGIRLGAVVAGSRERPDGTRVRWQFTDPGTMVADGIVPFFIDWGTSPHPADTPLQRLRLADLRAEHPDPGPVRRMLAALGLDLSVESAERPALIATFEHAGGRLELR